MGAQGKEEDPDPPADETLLELEGIEKSYRAGEIEVPVLRGIDLRIRRGRLVVILGPSGSGKTTLLNVLGGIERPDKGRVLFEGLDIAELDEQELTGIRRQRVGFVFQFYNLIPSLTARENVQVGTEGVPDAMDPGEALELVGLAHRADHFPSQLSGGEQQRVAIARAVGKRPGILLCDELTGALDSATGRRILEVVVRLNEELGVTIVVITHAAPIAELAHEVVRIDSGRVIETRENATRRRPEEIVW